MTDSQTVPGVWGSPVQDAPSPQPTVAPANPWQQEAQPQQTIPQSPQESPLQNDPWAKPADQQQVNVGQLEAPVTPPAQETSPDNDAEKRLAELQSQLREREQRDEALRAQWDQMQANQKRQQDLAMVKKYHDELFQEAANRAKFLDQDQAIEYLQQQNAKITENYNRAIDHLNQVHEQDKQRILSEATAPVWAQRLVQENGLPSDYLQYLNSVPPQEMGKMIPVLKALYDTQQKVTQTAQQTQASNFNQFQRQATPPVAGGNTLGSAPAQFELGSIEHLASLTRGW